MLATVGIAGSGYTRDVDARVFLNAAQIIDSTMQNAVDTLVRSAKKNGWWTLCNAIYPFVGGTASAHKFNLKDPRDLDAAFRLSFIGGTHSSTGWLPNGTSDYADTFLTPSVTLGLDDAHVSYYSRTNTAGGTQREMGATSPSNLYFRMRVSGDTLSGVIHASSLPSIATTNSIGHLIISRTASNSTSIFKDGVNVGNQGTASFSRPTFSITIGAVNAGGVKSFFSNRECAFATIGSGVSDAIAALMYADIQAYQTALSRQI